MDSATRHQYLKAMGISQWRRRDQSVVSDPTEANMVVSEDEIETQGQLPSLDSALARAIAEPPPSILEQATQTRQSRSAQPLTPKIETSSSPAPADMSSLDWSALEATVKACTLCSLCKGRTQAVFGVGDQGADLLVVGEAPGAEEDKQGLPFVGPAGQLLDAMLKAIDYARYPAAGQRGAYIANIVKCRPPDNRDPAPEEAAACRSYLDRQIALVQPKLILAVGGVAAKNLLASDEPVGRMRGEVYAYGEARIPLLVTYHPAYLLRSPSEKRKAWDDLKRARDLLSGA